MRYGKTQSGSPNFRCRGCSRCFVERPKRGPVPDATKALVRRLLLERVSLRGVARATGLSRSWLQRFVNDLYRDKTPWEPAPAPPAPPRAAADPGSAKKKSARPG